MLPFKGVCGFCGDLFFRVLGLSGQGLGFWGLGFRVGCAVICSSWV